MSDSKQLTAKHAHYATDSHTVFRDVHDNYKQRDTTTVCVRRVVNSARGEELQVEIDLHTLYKKTNRTKQSFGSLTLSPADADILAQACAQIRKQEIAA